MSQLVDPPETPGSRVGDDLQRQMMEQAEHERLAEAGESAPAKRPWWKFWS